MPGGGEHIELHSYTVLGNFHQKAVFPRLGSPLELGTIQSGMSVCFPSNQGPSEVKTKRYTDIDPIMSTGAG